MGMDLTRVRDGAYFRWNRSYWFAVLELAYQYGWQPMGTELKYDKYGHDRSSDWNGDYRLNCGQTITPQDARRIADALERALPDVPAEEAVTAKMTTYEGARARSCQADQPVILIAGPNSYSPRRFELEVWQEVNLFEKLAGTQDYIREFIQYLRGGGCRIL